MDIVGIFNGYGWDIVGNIKRDIKRDINGKLMGN
jgi:hypothetical protein